MGRSVTPLAGKPQMPLEITVDKYPAQRCRFFVVFGKGPPLKSTEKGCPVFPDSTPASFFQVLIVLRDHCEIVSKRPWHTPFPNGAQPCSTYNKHTHTTHTDTRTPRVVFSKFAAFLVSSVGFQDPCCRETYPSDILQPCVF